MLAPEPCMARHFISARNSKSLRRNVLVARHGKRRISSRKPTRRVWRAMRWLSRKLRAKASKPVHRPQMRNTNTSLIVNGGNNEMASGRFFVTLAGKRCSFSRALIILIIVLSQVSFHAGYAPRSPAVDNPQASILNAWRGGEKQPPSGSPAICPCPCPASPMYPRPFPILPRHGVVSIIQPYIHHSRMAVKRPGQEMERGGGTGRRHSCALHAATAFLRLPRDLGLLILLLACITSASGCDMTCGRKRSNARN